MGMTREEIKNIVRHVFHFYEVNAENCNWTDMNEACGEIFKALEQEPYEDAISRQEVLYLIADDDLSMGQVVRGIHALPSVTPQEPRWIPVSERLPDEGYSVLVMRITDDNYKYMRVATYQGDCWMDDTDKFNKPNPHKVIAWMPLPKAYSEVEE